jgi:hypothetical protein
MTTFARHANTAYLPCFSQPSAFHCLILTLTLRGTDACLCIHPLDHVPAYMYSTREIWPYKVPAIISAMLALA